MINIVETIEIEYKKLDSMNHQENNDLISCQGGSAELKRNNKTTLNKLIGRYVLLFHQGRKEH